MTNFTAVAVSEIHDTSLLLLMLLRLYSISRHHALSLMGLQLA